MSESNMVTKIEDIPKRYIAVWNEPGAEARRQAVAELWAEDGAYTDPLAVVEGHEAIEAVISGAREQFPGLIFRLLGDVDAHHHIVRFGWELAPEGVDESVVEGFDVMVVADDVRVQNVYGFLDKIPTA